MVRFSSCVSWLKARQAAVAASAASALLGVLIGCLSVAGCSGCDSSSPRNPGRLRSSSEESHQPAPRTYSEEEVQRRIRVDRVLQNQERAIDVQKDK